VKKLSSLSCLICLLVPGSVALSQPFPSFMLDSTIRRVPPFASIGHTHVAFGPEMGLATWGEEGRLRATRIDNRGLLLDTIPIDIGGPSGRTGVAWGGGGFLVAWTRRLSLTPGRAECALVDTNGHVVWRRVLHDSVGQGKRAAAAYDGTNFLVAWVARNERDTFTVYFSRVSPAGVVLDSPPRRAAPRAPVEQYDVAIGFHQDRYMAVWNHYDTGGLWGSWIMPDGTVPDSVGFPIRTGVPVDYPTVTHDRQNYVVSWYEQHYKTKLARVTDSGQVLDSAGIVVDTTSLWENDVCSTGDTTLVVFFSDSHWEGDSLTPMAVRVDTALQPIGAPVALAWPSDGNVYGNGPTALAAAVAGDGFGITWAQPSQDISVRGTCVAWFRRLNQQGQLLDTAPVPMSFGPNDQLSPDVASDGTDFLAVWAETRYESGAITRPLVGRRFSAAGAMLDTQSTRVGGTGVWKPALAFCDGCYLAAWPNGDSAVAARIAQDGRLLDTVPILLSGPDELASLPAVAGGDTTFLVAWATSDAHIHGVRVATSGSVLDSVPLLLQKNHSYSSHFPQVAFDGANFLVARDDRTQPGGLGWNGFSAVRVDADGQIVDPDDIKFAAASSWPTTPGIAYGDGVYLVTNNERCVSWRISTDGQVLDSVPHANSGNARTCFDGLSFLLLCAGDSTGKLAGMRISPEGVLIDRTPFLLVDAQRSGVSPEYSSLVANDAKRIGLVFQDFEPAPWLTNRVRACAFAALAVGSVRDLSTPAPLCVLPTPASRMATLSFNMAQAGQVRLTTFDAAGRRCASLFSGPMKAGAQTLQMDTRRLANGVYFLRLEAGTTRHSTRLVVSR